MTRLAAVIVAIAAAGCPAGGRGPDGPVKASAAGLGLTYYIDRKPVTRNADGTPQADSGEVERVVVVEQRRWVDVGADRTLEIDQIDDGADLESLVIESLSGDGLVLGRCGRDSVVDALRSAQTSWIGRKAEITILDGRSASGTITSIAGDQVILVDDAGKTTAVTTTNWRALRLLGGDSLVRCQVESGSGRNLVRVVYTTSALGFHAEHVMHVALDADGKGTVEITPRFTVDTPAWQVTADIALYDGIPGGARAPREVFRGPITLTGDSVVVSGPSHTAKARLDAIYQGAMISPGESPREPYWRNGSTLDVWDWLDLELGEDSLPPGRVMLEIARAGEPMPEPVIVEADAIEVTEPDADAGHVRIKLWPAIELRGQRIKFPINTMTNELVESILFSVSNGGDRPREVVIEEEMRPAKRRSVLRPFPKKPTVRNNILRTRILARPGHAARAGYVLDYTW